MHSGNSVFINFVLFCQGSYTKNENGIFLQIIEDGLYGRQPPDQRKGRGARIQNVSFVERL